MRQSTKRRYIRRSTLMTAAAVLTATIVIAQPTLALAAEVPDVTPPVITLEYPETPASGWYTEPVTVKVSATDDTAVTKVVSRVGGAQTNHTTPFEIELQEGVSSAEFTAYDAAGNSSQKALTVRVDAHAPALDMQLRPSYSVGEVAYAEFTCLDELSGVQSCSAENGGLLDTSQAGYAHVTVTAVDRAGNSVTDDYAYVVFAPDVTRPTVSFSAPAPSSSGWYTAPVLVDMVGTDDTGMQSVRYAMSGAQTGSNSFAGSSAYVEVEQDGVTTIQAIATDRVGNESEPQSFSVELDQTAPTVAFESLTSDGSVPRIGQGKAVLLGYSCDDATSGVASCTAGPAEKTIEREVELDTDELGEHEVTVTATDMAGNVHEESFAYTVVPLDSSIPVLEYVVPEPEESGWYREDVTVDIAATDDEAVDHIDWATRGAQEGEGVLGAEGGSVTVGTDGETEVWMFATDTQQNIGELEKVAIKRDATTPVITASVNGQPGASFAFRQGVSSTLDIACSDATSGVEDCDVAGGELTQGGEVIVDTTQLGEHTITVSARDVAGNAISQDVTYTVAAAAGSTGNVSDDASASVLAATGGPVGPILPLTALALMIAAGALGLGARKRRS